MPDKRRRRGAHQQTDGEDHGGDRRSCPAPIEPGRQPVLGRLLSDPLEDVADDRAAQEGSLDATDKLRNAPVGRHKSAARGTRGQVCLQP